MIYAHAHDVITDDVFVALPYLSRRADVYLKIEGFNPAGSIKLKTALGLVEDAERRGTVSVGVPVIESSSGNLGIALSSICAAKGYPFTCVVDPNTSQPAIAHMRALGAEVVTVRKTDSNGGYLHSRIAYIQERLQRQPEMVWLNQYANPANAAAHYDRTAKNLLAGLGHIDQLFVGTGSTGTFVGCARYLREHSPHTRIIAVDSLGSVTFGAEPGRRWIPGLGASRRPELCRPELAHEIVHVAEEDAIRECRRVARNTGLLVGGSTGSVLAAVAAREEGFRDRPRVAVISPDLGDRYLKTVYDDEWVNDRFGDVLAGEAPDLVGVPAGG
ncbi:2,3-diaminopropionate biosynthesis protein SbnA [Actinomadura sp. DC4]|uniref:2,3-diaminopropionate biosynthesis protein SbnA n=1 Tax=Actinomadura sp. DC4 TaxID=3055069 RepID=UPI0025AF9511|nr:2,3-diaminopropionate biosynthesis protein SbnA [Actinomadura sp. DC4]MDN3356438.1 2,3-diaminopropionate biosynthesis protein SbnA [Actinomadura sp. DC4]